MSGIVVYDLPSPVDIFIVLLVCWFLWKSTERL